MYRFIPVAVLLCVAATPGFAADNPISADPMAAYYGNTLVSLDGGIESFTYFNADHTFTGKAPAYGFTYQGTWSFEGDTLCRVYDPPLPGEKNPDCGPLRLYKIGDKEKDPNGDGQVLVEGIR